MPPTDRRDSDGEMRTTGTNEQALVVAAQAGDRRALDDLVTAHLPLVYTIVRRALSGHPDVDDVVQDTMLRALRELGELRSPASFRVWLAAIAVRQVGTHLHRRGLAARRTAALDEIIETPDADADFTSLTMLQLELSGQRRQVVQAGRWLDPDDRALLSLWWLEVAGQLSRGELAEVLGVSIAHAGVRVQRMRAQLDLTRSLVAALDARPRCLGLTRVLADWDGAASPLWRKRIGRHVRSCAVCGRAAGELVATERLLVGFALLPVPLALAAGVLGKLALGGAATATAAALSGAVAGSGLGAGAKAGLFGQFIQAVITHPVVSTVVAGTVVAGAAVTTTVTWSEPPPPPMTVVAVPSTARPVLRTTRAPASPTPAAVAPSAAVAVPVPTPTRPLAVGPNSLESGNEPGYFVSTTDTYGVLTPVGAGADSQTRQAATFIAVPGLEDPNCFSFRLPDGRYLRHSMWRLRVSADDGTDLFKGDATFCVRPGASAGSIALQSHNYPGAYLHRRGNELWVDFTDGSAAFLADSSFRVRSPLTG